MQGDSDLHFIKKRDEFRVKIRRKFIEETLQSKRSKLFDMPNPSSSNPQTFLNINASFPKDEASSREMILCLDKQLKESDENIIEAVDRIFESNYIPLILKYIDLQYINDQEIQIYSSSICANISITNNSSYFDILRTNRFISKLVILLKTTKNSIIQENLIWALTNISQESSQLKSEIYSETHEIFPNLITNANCSESLLKTTLWFFEVQLNTDGKFPLVENLSKEICLFLRNSLENAKDLGVLASVLKTMVVVYNIEAWTHLFISFLNVELILPFLFTENMRINFLALNCLKAYSYLEYEFSNVFRNLLKKGFTEANFH